MKQSLLHVVLVGLDHLFDHLAAHGTGLTAGQVAVVAVLQVDANLSGGPSNILKPLYMGLCRLVFDDFRSFTNEFIVYMNCLLVGDFTTGINHNTGRISFRLDNNAVNEGSQYLLAKLSDFSVSFRKSEKLVVCCFRCIHILIL